MITGFLMVLFGLPYAFYSSTRFNLGGLFVGYCIASAGAFILFIRALDAAGLSIP